MQNSTNEWLDSIATRAKVSQDDVKSFLANNHIYASPLPGTPHRLVLTEIQFSGEKTGNINSGAFSFSWSSLSNGVWGILSNENFRGKSSIIEIIKWLLRGDCPQKLQEDVKSWVQKASLCFLLDHDSYEVSFLRQETFSGNLAKFNPDGTKKVLIAFSSESSFKLAMEDFFFKSIGLESIVNWREGSDDQDVGQAIQHGWPALSGVMFIGTNYDSVLGDMPVQSGISARLMQMFLGLPWATTLFSARNALKSIEAKEKAQFNTEAVDLKWRNERIAGAEKELKEKEQLYSVMPSDKSLRSTLDAKNTEYAKKKRAERSFNAELEILQNELGALEKVQKEDKRALRQHLESLAAGTFFRTLEPTCCPCCDTDLDGSKKDIPTNACALCGEILHESQEDSSHKERLEDNIEKTKKSIASAKEQIIACNIYIEQNIEECKNIQDDINIVEKRLEGFKERDDLATQIEVLKGKIEELNQRPTYSTLEKRIKSIAKSIEHVTSELFKKLQKDILKDVSAQLVCYANKFGISQLENAEVTSNAHLLLTKGGIDTSYSKVTDGEKLRLKVALALAMLKVAEERGVGRHPGLLIVDSPKAQEMAEADFEALVEGISEIATELPFLQIFIAGRSSELLQAKISESNRKEALGKAYLW